MALLHACLAEARGSPQARDRARQCLDEAIETVATEAIGSSFWGGFVGVAWAAELVDRLLDPNGEDRNEAVDDVLLQLLSRPRAWLAPHDLVGGVTGLGVYALDRYPRPMAVRCLHRVVERLEESAQHDEQGIYWWTPPAEMDPEMRERYPVGCAELGVAHGVAGAIGLLGAVCGAGVEQATVRALLEQAVNWLMAQALTTGAGPTFPSLVAPGFDPTPARCAWCYGDPGVAATLMMAARGAGELRWEREAVALACRAAERPEVETGVVDASFCHGAAGLAHIYNRLFQATGEPTLKRTALYWLERTLEFYRLASGNGDMWVKGSENPTKGPWGGIELVRGAAGVALVLLAASTSVEPVWDRMFLLSAPDQPSQLNGR
jgi:hypothetical protein